MAPKARGHGAPLASFRTLAFLLAAVLGGVAALVAGLSGGCAPADPEAMAAVDGGSRGAGASALDPLAEAYVKLVLAAGRHDPRIVDAYYGPRAWGEEAVQGPPAPLEELRGRARTLLAQIRTAAASDRRTFLETQLVALEADLRRRTGEPLSLAEEARLLFDVEPVYTSLDRLEAARARIEPLLPGEGDLPARAEALRTRFAVPQTARVKVVRAVLDETRRRTAAAVELPRGEGVLIRPVTGKSWSAYNWYVGKLKSRIELNTDLPDDVVHLARKLVHEAYPGHHVLHALREDRLLRRKGWVETTVHPLWSPLSLIAEGTAEAGWDVVFPDGQGDAFLREVVAPLAGVDDPEGLDRLLALEDAMRELRGARPVAARMLLEEGRPEAEVRDFLVRYELVPPERADRSIRFIREYRAYVFAYPLGRNLVERHLGSGPDRAERFFRLLQQPTAPSALAGSVAVAEGS